MEYGIVIGVAVVLGLSGGVLLALMNAVRNALPGASNRPLTICLKVVGVAVLCLYAVPAVLFSIAFMLQVRNVGANAFESQKEIIAAVTFAGVVCGGIGISLFVLGLRVEQIEHHGRTLHYDPLVILMIATGYVLLTVAGAILTLAAVVLAILLFLIVLRFLMGRQEEKQAAALWTLTLAADGQRSIAQELRDFAAGQWGVFGHRARYAASLMDQGYSVSAALEAVPGLIPRSALALIRVGEEAGTLPAALRQATRIFSSRAQRRQHSSAAEMFWLLLWTVIAQSVLVTTGLMVFIIPKYKRIFAEFNTELPAMTQALIEVNNLAMRTWLVWIIPAALVLVAKVYLTILIYSLIAGSDPLESWLLPRLRPRVATAAILRCLAMVFRAGRPLSGPLRVLAENFPAASLRPRLQQVALDVGRGGEVWTALRDQKFVKSTEIELLYAADRAGHLPWAIDSLADNLERRSGYRLLLVMEFLQPVLVATAGAVVFFIDVAMFLPLVKLVNDLS